MGLGLNLRKFAHTIGIDGEACARQNMCMDQSEDSAPTAYDRVGWDQLSPFARGEIDRLAREQGITLHALTDEATLRRFIAMYRSAW